MTLSLSSDPARRQNDWLIIERKPVEPEVRRHKDDAYMRGVMTMNVSYVECVDMMCYFGERRRLWDTNFRGIELPFGGNFILDDDCRFISKIDFGTLMHMAGIPRHLNTKLYRRWDHPVKGQVTTALVPWDHKMDCLNLDDSILTVKCSTIMPHPTDPAKSKITTLEVRSPSHPLHLYPSLWLISFVSSFGHLLVLTQLPLLFPFSIPQPLCHAWHLSHV